MQIFGSGNNFLDMEKTFEIMEKPAGARFLKVILYTFGCEVLADSVWKSLDGKVGTRMASGPNELCRNKTNKEKGEARVSANGQGR